MATLDAKEERRALTDAVRPPAGYVLGACAATAYSLDFDAFTAVLLAFVRADYEEGVPDSPSVLTSIARLRSRVRVYVDAGGLHPPSSNRLFALYDGIIRRVSIKGTAFHPKVWALRFDPVSRPERHTAPALFRVLCASRNVTDSTSWELGAVVNGQAGDHKQPFGMDVAAFIKRLAASRDFPKELWKLIEGLRTASFEIAREWADELRLEWQWPGPKPLKAKLPASASRALVISPFIRADFLDSIFKRVDDLIVVSAQEELDALPDSAHQQLAKAQTFVVREGEIDDTPTFELHAKLLAWESGTQRETMIGSANATGPGWGVSGRANVEAMVSMRPGLRIDDVLKAFVSPTKGELHGWIDRYQRLVVKPDEEEEAQRLLKSTKRALCEQHITARFDLKSATLVLSIDGPSKVSPIPEHIAATIMPLLSRDTNAWKDYADLHDDGAQFRRTELEDVSAFALVRLLDTNREGMELRFCVQCTLEMNEQQLEERDGAVNARLLEGVDPRALLLNVLNGLPAGSGIVLRSDRHGKGQPGAGPLLRQATIERIMEACTADPGRMLEIEAVLHACEGSAEMVQFQAFWKVFRLALNEVEAIG